MSERNKGLGIATQITCYLFAMMGSICIGGYFLSVGIFIGLFMFVSIAVMLVDDICSALRDGRDRREGSKRG